MSARESRRTHPRSCHSNFVIVTSRLAAYPCRLLPATSRRGASARLAQGAPAEKPSRLREVCRPRPASRGARPRASPARGGLPARRYLRTPCEARPGELPLALLLPWAGGGRPDSWSHEGRQSVGRGHRSRNRAKTEVPEATRG